MKQFRKPSRSDKLQWRGLLLAILIAVACLAANVSAQTSGSPPSGSSNPTTSSPRPPTTSSSGSPPPAIKSPSTPPPTSSPKPPSSTSSGSSGSPVVQASALSSSSTGSSAIRSIPSSSGSSSSPSNPPPSPQPQPIPPPTPSTPPPPQQQQPTMPPPTTDIPVPESVPTSTTNPYTTTTPTDVTPTDGTTTTTTDTPIIGAGNFISTDVFRLTAVTLDDVTKNLDPMVTVLSFEQARPGAWSDGSADYQLQLQMQNNATTTVAVQSLTTFIYEGKITEVPPDEVQKPIHVSTPPSALQNELPSILPGKFWPDGGAPVSFPSSLIGSDGCKPTALTLVVRTGFTAGGKDASQQQLVPISISPKCLIKPTDENGNTLTVQITVGGDGYMQTSEDQIPFLIDFGGKVQEDVPTRLFNVTGASRIDVVYARTQGKVALMVYPLGEATEKDTLITVTVPAGVTQNTAGVPNTAAELSVYYKPVSDRLQYFSYGLSGLFAVGTGTSWLTSFVVSCMQPFNTAGSLGYGMIGWVLWAQRFYQSGLITTPNLPSNYRTVANQFWWADYQANLPWDWSGSDSSSEVLLKPDNIFVSMAVMEVGEDGQLVMFDPPNGPPVYNFGNNNNKKTPVDDDTVGVGKDDTMTNSTTIDGTDDGNSSTDIFNQPVGPEEPAVVVEEEPVLPTPAPPVQEVKPPPVPPPPEPSCNISDNVDYFSGDIENGKRENVENPTICCNMCTNTQGCAVWTWVKGDKNCYLKGATGWTKKTNASCCVSGTKLASSPPSTTITASNPPSTQTQSSSSTTTTPRPPTSSSSSPVVVQAQSNPPPSNPPPSNPPPSNPPPSSPRPPPTSNPPSNPPPSSSSSSRPSALDIVNNILGNNSSGRKLMQSAADAPVQRYIVMSIGVPNPGQADSENIYTLNPTESWDKSRHMMALADPSFKYEDSTNPYDPLYKALFWMTLLLCSACLFAFSAWLIVLVSDGEVPGALYFPRMQVTTIMFAMSALGLASAELFSSGNLLEICIGVGVAIVGPVLFIGGMHFFLQKALYKKKRSAYLLTRTTRSKKDTAWDKSVVKGWMGMSLNRGKWKNPDPIKRNDFTFRWGPVFEDCRGPLHKRRKINIPGGGSMVSPLSSARSSSRNHQHEGGVAGPGGGGGGAPSESSSGSAPAPAEILNRVSSRKKVAQVEEAPMMACCGHAVYRSTFQAYGTLISLARMVLFGFIIGGLAATPEVQCGMLILLSTIYMIYLRMIVPYSRRDEMALEYFVCLLDMVIYCIALALCFESSSDFSSQDSLGTAMLALQVVSFVCYLLNRILIVVHAFSEVVCAGCCLEPYESEAEMKRRSSSSKSSSMSKDGRRRTNSQSYRISASAGVADYLDSARYGSESGRSDHIAMEEGGVRRYNGEMDYADDDGTVDNPGAAPGHNTAVRYNNNNNSSSSSRGRMGSFPCIPEEGGESEGDHTGRQNKDGVWDKFWGSL